MEKLDALSARALELESGDKVPFTNIQSRSQPLMYAGEGILASPDNQIGEDWARIPGIQGFSTADLPYLDTCFCSLHKIGMTTQKLMEELDASKNMESTRPVTLAISLPHQRYLNCSDSELFQSALDLEKSHITIQNLELSEATVRYARISLPPLRVLTL